MPTCCLRCAELGRALGWGVGGWGGGSGGLVLGTGEAGGSRGAASGAAALGTGPSPAGRSGDLRLFTGAALAGAGDVALRAGDSGSLDLVGSESGAGEGAGGLAGGGVAIEAGNGWAGGRDGRGGGVVLRPGRGGLGPAERELAERQFASTAAIKRRRGHAVDDRDPGPLDGAVEVGDGGPVSLLLSLSLSLLLRRVPAFGRE